MRKVTAHKNAKTRAFSVFVVTTFAAIFIGMSILVMYNPFSNYVKWQDQRFGFHSR